MKNAQLKSTWPRPLERGEHSLSSRPSLSPLSLESRNTHPPAVQHHLPCLCYMTVFILSDVSPLCMLKWDLFKLLNQGKGLIFRLVSCDTFCSMLLFLLREVLKRGGTVGDLMASMYQRQNFVPLWQTNMVEFTLQTQQVAHEAISSLWLVHGFSALSGHRPDLHERELFSEPHNKVHGALSGKIIRFQFFKSSIQVDDHPWILTKWLEQSGVVIREFSVRFSNATSSDWNS